MTSSIRQCIAILYATTGGMGDVGKFAATQAFKTAGVDIRVVAMSSSSQEGFDKGIDADVTDEAIRKRLKEELGAISSQYVDVDSENAQSDLENIFENVDAVVACLGNRQPGYARWIAAGATNVTAAMKSKKVNRLVILSSFGIGDDYMPISPIGILWRTMLRTVINSARKDLNEMERIVQGSNLDYLLVRTVGISPERAPEDKWKILTSRQDGEVTLDIAKADVASFMLEEALKPALHSTAITIGRDAAPQEL